MSYIKCTVSTNSDEQTFIKTFIKKLTESDSRITCDTDIDGQFYDTQYSSSTPTIEINFGINSKIVLTRTSSLRTAVNGYNIKSCINSTEREVMLYFSETGTGYNEAVERTWQFRVIANENTLYLAFADFDKDFSNTKLSVMNISDSDFSVSSYGSKTEDGTDASTNVLYYTDGSNQNLALNFADRLTYEASEGKVEIIKNKALLDKTKKTKIREFLGLYDCSTVPSNSFLRIDNENYYALSSYTLMPLN